jgi:hypothetical protein
MKTKQGLYRVANNLCWVCGMKLKRRHLLDHCCPSCFIDECECKSCPYVVGCEYGVMRKRLYEEMEIEHEMGL